MLAFQQLVSSYNASGHGVQVTVQPISTDPVVQRALYGQAADAGALPALTAVDTSLTQYIVDEGRVVDASACLKAAGKETGGELPVARSAYTVDGKQWAASANLVTPLLYFRRGAFLAAGLDPDKPPTSLDQVHEAAKAMQEKGVATRPLALRLDSALVENWLTGAGINVVNHGNGRDQRADEGDMTSPKATQLFEWIQTMAADGLLELIPAAADGAEPRTGHHAPDRGHDDRALDRDQRLRPHRVGRRPRSRRGRAARASRAPGHGQVGGVAWYLTKDVPPDPDRGGVGLRPVPQLGAEPGHLEPRRRLPAVQPEGGGRPGPGRGVERQPSRTLARHRLHPGDQPRSRWPRSR